MATQEVPKPLSGARSTLLARWNVRTPDELDRRCQELALGQDILEGLIPQQSLCIAVGDSGKGKTPLLLQMAICVAAGREFFGRAVRPGSVLYVACEDGLKPLSLMISRLSLFIGLDKAPGNLLTWNSYDAPLNWGQENWKFENLIDDVGPSLVIVDPLTGMFPDVEEKNSEASKTLGNLRRIMSAGKCSMVFSHHLKKPGTDTWTTPSLETSKVHDWFLQARGARALINACDVRIGIDEPSTPFTMPNGRDELALVVRGFARMAGELPTMHLIREFDEDGQAVGYSLARGAILLRNEEQRKALADLPSVFRHTDAKRVYGRGSQATTDWLRKCEGLRLIQQRTDRQYEKLEATDQTD